MPIKKRNFCPCHQCIKAAGEREGECYSIELEKEKENVTASKLDPILLLLVKVHVRAQLEIQELKRIVDENEKLMRQQRKVEPILSMLLSMA